MFDTFGAVVLQTQDKTKINSITETETDATAYLKIEGMHCSSCETLFQYIGKSKPGISNVAASYATSTARIVYDSDFYKPADLPTIFKTAGYRITLRDALTINDQEQDEKRRTLRASFATALAAIIMMLYVAFLYPIHLGIVDPSELEPVRWLVFGAVPFIIFSVTTIMVVFLGWPIYMGGWTGLRSGVLNMDNLLSIAILAAYCYSVINYLNGNVDELYFDVTASIIFVVTLGRYFEHKSRRASSNELESLIDRWAPMARVYRDEKYTLIPSHDLLEGEKIFLEPGDIIPLDAIVCQGKAAIDMSVLTGETYPVEVVAGIRTIC